MKLYILLVPQPLHPEHAYIYIYIYIYSSVDGLYARIINHQSFTPAVAVVVVVVVVMVVSGGGGGGGGAVVDDG